jgi:hypothetical protein
MIHSKNMIAKSGTAPRGRRQGPTRRISPLHPASPTRQRPNTQSSVSGPRRQRPSHPLLLLHLFLLPPSRLLPPHREPPEHSSTPNRGIVVESQMKFGKDFRNHLEETLPAWRDKYLAYKALKKLIKRLPPPADAPPPPPPLPPLPAPAEGDGPGAGQGNVALALGDWFARILDMELHKLNDFYMEREEWYVIRLQVPPPPPPPPCSSISPRSRSVVVEL